MAALFPASPPELLLKVIFIEQALQEYIGDGTMHMGDLMTVSHQGGKKKIQKRSWTEEEDAKLLELVRIHGTKVRGFWLLLKVDLWMMCLTVNSDRVLTSLFLHFMSSFVHFST